MSDTKKSLKNEDKVIGLEAADVASVADRPALLTQATAIRNDIRATQVGASALTIRTRADAIGTAGALRRQVRPGLYHDLVDADVPRLSAHHLTNHGPR